LLKEGTEIPDEVYVQLFVAKLRMTYPHKSKRQLRYELRIRVEKERSILKELEPLQRELEEIEEYKRNAVPGTRRRRGVDPDVLFERMLKLRVRIRAILVNIEKWLDSS